MEPLSNPLERAHDPGSVERGRAQTGRLHSGEYARDKVIRCCLRGRCIDILCNE